LENYYENRTFISEKFYYALNDKLSTTIKCNVPLGKFQLGRIYLPSTLLDQNKNVFRLSQENEQQTYDSDAAVIRKTTQTLQEEYYANITLIQNVAQSAYDAMISNANAQAQYQQQILLGQMIQKAFSTLNITNADDKKLFLQYINIISGDIGVNSMSVGFSSNVLINQ